MLVIVGANLAGGRAAEALRAGGSQERIVLVGAEPERPYERPPLSKTFPAGQLPEEKVYLRPSDYYANHGIELLLGRRAVRVDPQAKTVELEDGEHLGYTALLIATGATPRRLTAPGGDLEGIVYLRDLRDARRLRERLPSAQRVVVVGAGFIGAEVAAVARSLGREVVALEALPVPLERALGPVVGGLYAEIHRARGVDLRTNEAVTEIAGSGGEFQVRTASGARFDCDLVVVGVGVAPEVGWLESSGIELRN